jgi:hypothetical protein
MNLTTAEDYLVPMVETLLVSNHGVGDGIDSWNDLAVTLNDKGYRNRSGKDLNGVSLRKWAQKFRNSPELLETYAGMLDLLHYRNRFHKYAMVKDPSEYL